MPNIISVINVGGTNYDIHDARITGGVLNFRGITTDTTIKDEASVTQTATPAYTEGDVIIRPVTSGGVSTSKEFVVVNAGTTQTPALQ